jgi:uncharacterized paraquat-inducible protein A
MDEQKPWVCQQCEQIHWHRAAGICSRCLGPLTEKFNGTRTSKEL